MPASAGISFPFGLALDATGFLYVSDEALNLVWKVDLAGNAYPMMAAPAGELRSSLFPTYV